MLKTISIINGPAFSAYTNATATVFASGAFTKVALANEEFDTNSCFDSTTNYRFTPNVPGYYQINGGLSLNANAGLSIVCIFKNGSRYKDGTWQNTTGGLQTHSDVSSLIYFNGTTDYVELYGFQSSGGPVSNNSQNQVFSTYFNGSFVRSA